MPQGTCHLPMRHACITRRMTFVCQTILLVQVGGSGAHLIFQQSDNDSDCQNDKWVTLPEQLSQCIHAMHMIAIACDSKHLGWRQENKKWHGILLCCGRKLSQNPNSAALFEFCPTWIGMSQWLTHQSSGRSCKMCTQAAVKASLSFK